MRSVDIPRQDGWIGGVCAGIGARLGIDPLVVRGIFVVVAILGGPALLLYAAAWLLLPDRFDKIHLEEVTKGRLEAPIAGIAAFIVLSMLPVTQGFWWLGATFWADPYSGAPYWGASAGRALWTLVVLGLLVWFVVWIARRAGRASDTPTVSPATTDHRPETIPVPMEGQATPPPQPAAGASADEVADWREQQALWKQQRAEWKAQQAASDREVRQQAAAAARERNALAAEEARERRRQHRLANPRIPAGIALIAFGLATVTGALAALAASASASAGGYDSTIGLAAASMVLGLSIVAAGALRRRSGTLGFFATLLILATLISASIPRDRILVPAGWSVGQVHEGSYAQPLGGGRIYIDADTGGGVIDYWQGAGELTVYIADGSAARFEIVSRSGYVSLYQYVAVPDGANYEYWPISGEWNDAGEWTASLTVGDETVDASPLIRIWQGSGSIYIENQNEPSVDEETQE